MKKIILSLFSLFTLGYSAGTYDGYAFTDTEEKYALHFLNTALSLELSGNGLSTNDATAIIGLRPIISLSTVASNSNITGRDMVLIRSASYRFQIPDTSPYNEYNALGMKIYDYNFLMALMGLLVGFMLMFSIIIGIHNVAKGHK